MTEQEIRDNAPSGSSHYFVGIILACKPQTIHEKMKNVIDGWYLPVINDTFRASAFDVIGCHPIAHDIGKFYPDSSLLVTLNDSKVTYFKKTERSQSIFEFGKWVTINAEWINFALLEPL